MRYDREILLHVLVYHQRLDIKGCLCGWAVLGASHSEHVADVYETTLHTPDVWYENGQGREMRYWCLDGVWYWRNVDEDGTVLAEGLGAP